MKGVTDCAVRNKEVFHSVYFYNEQKERKGGIYKYSPDTSCQLEGQGTFSISLTENKLIASEYTGISIYSENLKSIKNFSIGVSYMHCRDKNTLYSTSSLGRYSKIDLKKETVEEYQMDCSSGKCIHEVWMAHKTENILLLGCDVGTLSAVDTRTNQTVTTYAFQTGVTWIGQVYNEVTVGTYGGEYATVNGASVTAPQQVDGTIWRVSEIFHEKQHALLVTQAYDGISVRNKNMLPIVHKRTDDLIYSAHVYNGNIIAHGYYTGEDTYIPT
ncbi:hypothetical protein NEFER03_0745 [Nematocida sp. LUAm3]|nr:hypothetical protein NEFER03_0745 [Nematocida sp. LUAm3]KAI5175204.1 hypothetical protein NEFER02_1165 [Nematocida sp. LUAm2]KAI5178124.1 hypothetical protein NEFER01_1302 [Nematocida sp. LUAm1]